MYSHISDCRQNEKDDEYLGFGRGVPFHQICKKSGHVPDFLHLAGRKSRMKCGIYANSRPVPGGAHEGDVRLLCRLWSPLRASLVT